MKIIDIVKSRFNIPLTPKQTDNNNNLIGQVWEEKDQPNDPFMKKSKCIIVDFKENKDNVLYVKYRVVRESGDISPIEHSNTFEYFTKNKTRIK